MDYYETLGVARTATPDEIKTAYRKLAMKHHPDRGGDPAQFQEITTAYNTLSDADKRAQYDNPRPQFNQGWSQHADMDDMLWQFFGKRGGRPQSKNPDSVADIDITFEQAYAGANLNVNLGYATESITVPAGVRDGTKLRLVERGPDHKNGLPVGDLIIRINVLYPPNVIRELDNLFVRVNINAIDAMMGRDLDIDHVSGKTVRIKIPPGTQPGTRMRVTGWGMLNPSTRKPGDLYAVVNVEIPAVTDQQHVEWLTLINSKEEAHE